MSLDLTGAYSSRIRRPTANAAALKRSKSFTLATRSRNKPGHKAEIFSPTPDNKSTDVPLDEDGKVVALAAHSPIKGITAAIEHALCNIFEEVPDRAGMNSTRIAQVLNYRKSLPTVVSLAHIHALTGASTRTERELVSLSVTGKVRRINISGRGNEISGLGEFVILQSQLEQQIRESSLDQSLQEGWIQILAANPKSSILPPHSLSTREAAELIKAGFLVAPSATTQTADRFIGQSHKISSSMQLAGNSASGSEGARGGKDAFSGLGGRGGSKKESLDHRALNVSIPNLGPYLRLLVDARLHLMSLLAKSKHRQAPLYLLRERWDGAIDADTRVSAAKRARGEFAGILPGKTKKWKQLYGLGFEWVLDECLGAGLVELFETHSVGYGVRGL